MVARAQTAAAAKQRKEEEEEQQQEEEEGKDSSEEDEVFAASLKATAARMGKLGITKSGGGGRGGGQGKGKVEQHVPKPAEAAASAAVFNEESIPSEYVCPISFGIMFSFVIAMDGHSYEQAAIEE
jgi:pyruvate/2-oxoglutarate dehydrogenase complex dihydrolipoamide acyltransferase (E2) component